MYSPPRMASKEPRLKSVWIVLCGYVQILVYSHTICSVAHQREMVVVKFQRAWKSLVLSGCHRALGPSSAVMTHVAHLTERIRHMRQYPPQQGTVCRLNCTIVYMSAELKWWDLLTLTSHIYLFFSRVSIKHMFFYTSIFFGFLGI